MTLDTLQLVHEPNIQLEMANIRAAYDSLSHAYPRFRSLTSRRVKVSYLLLFHVIGQELTLLIVRQWWPGAYSPLRKASLICWAGVAVWSHSYFL